MGTNIVVWCDEEGRICVAESVCPHLGSDLVPATGGRVRGGRLLCPFHGFEYDATGQCVATPFAAPPRNARLRVFQTQEILGLIFAWWGIKGREPQWRLPADSLDQAGWSRLEIRTTRFSGHPQETNRELRGFGPLPLRPQIRQREPYQSSVGGRFLSRVPLRLQADSEDRQNHNFDP